MDWWVVDVLLLYHSHYQPCMYLLYGTTLPTRISYKLSKKMLTEILNHKNVDFDSV